MKRKSAKIFFIILLIAVLSVNCYALGETQATVNESSVNKIQLTSPIFEFKNNINGIEIWWNRVPDAEEYIVLKKTQSGVQEIGTVNSASNTNFIDSNVADGEKYEYSVIAKNGEVRSESVFKITKMYLKTPQITLVKNFNGYVRVTWNKTNCADEYIIYKNADNTGWKELARVKSTDNTYADKAVKNGSNYAYRVVAKKDEVLSGFNENGVLVKYVSTPQNIKATNSYYNGSYITWNSVPNTVKYNVYRKGGDSAQWQLIAQVKLCSYQDKNLKNNTQYTYTVRAVGENGGLSFFLNGAKNLVVHKPAVQALNSKPEGILVSWSRVDGALGYRVYRRAAGEKSFQLVKKLYGINNRFYIDTTVKKGQYYAYTIRAVNGSTFGGFNKKGVYTRFIGAPIVSAKHSPKGIVLNWRVSQVGTGYQVQHKAQGDSSYKTIATISNKNTVSYTHTTPVYGKYNYYRIIVNGSICMTNTTNAFGIDPNKKMVALTYDDGPYTAVTNSILNTLQKNNARATFFVVGSRVNTYKACIQKANNMGCEIGNHSYNHTILTSVNGDKIKSEIAATNNAVKRITGKSPTLVRAPGGSVNSTVKGNVSYPLISWNVDTLDWKNRNANSVVNNIKNNVKDGSIILMHDLYSSTAQATQTIVPWLIKNGYQVVTVSEMYAVKGITLKNGTVYYGG